MVDILTKKLDEQLLDSADITDAQNQCDMAQVSNQRACGAHQCLGGIACAFSLWRHVAGSCWAFSIQGFRTQWNNFEIGLLAE